MSILNIKQNQEYLDHMRKCIARIMVKAGSAYSYAQLIPTDFVNDLVHSGYVSKTSAQEKGDAEWFVVSMIIDGTLTAEPCSVYGFKNIRLANKETSAADVTRLSNELVQQKAAHVETVRMLKEAIHVGKTLEAELSEEKKKAPGILRVDCFDKPGVKKARQVKGVFHSAFPKIVALAKARMNVFLFGPTGCGKSHVCGQLAEVLKLDFKFVSCTTGMSEGKVEGRLLPTGTNGNFEYVVSEFVAAYENGGVFLLDEMDAADPNVLLIINSALASDHMAVQNRPKKPYAKKHKDFVCVAAVNTIGTGADRMYSSRNKLDDATLDRFRIGKVLMDYDEKLEDSLVEDAELVRRLRCYRKGVRENRLERSVSTRFIRDAHKMKSEFGFTDQDVDDALFLGWREDEIGKVKQFYTPPVKPVVIPTQTQGTGVTSAVKEAFGRVKHTEVFSGENIPVCPAHPTTKMVRMTSNKGWRCGVPGNHYNKTLSNWSHCSYCKWDGDSKVTHSSQSHGEDQ